VTKGRTVHTLDRFYIEIQTAGLQLYDMREYRKVRTHVETHKTETENRLGSFISLLCQDRESVVIEAARTCLGDLGVTVRVNMYDGLMVDKGPAGSGSVPCDDDDDLARLLSSRVAKVVGFAVEFVHKPIERCTAEQVCIPALMHAIEPTDRVVLFGLEGTLVSREGVIHPGAKERLGQLQQEGIKLGLYRWSSTWC
jgi:hypothetical protein